jgi:E3 ubiquitin-protein ligase DOA10
MLRFYKIGIVSTYEIQDVIEAKSLKKALEIAEERYDQGFYMADDDEVKYHPPKFYERYLDFNELFEEEK